MSLALKSPILDASGDRAQSSLSWEPPRGSSPYFGWLGEDGFTTVRLDDIQAITPHPQMRGKSVIFMRAGLNVIINAADCERLIKRMGWTEPTNVGRA